MCLKRADVRFLLETQMAKDAVQDGQLITQPSKGVQKQFGLLSKLLYVGIFIPRRELCIIILTLTQYLFWSPAKVLKPRGICYFLILSIKVILCGILRENLRFPQLFLAWFLKGRVFLAVYPKSPRGPGASPVFFYMGKNVHNNFPSYGLNILEVLEGCPQEN